MQLDIRSTPTFYINMDSAVDRKATVERVAKAYGITDLRRFSGVVGATKRLGVSASHKAVLEHIIENDIYPSIVLEDDIMPYHWTHRIDVPDDADAFYLGLSKFAWRNPVGEDPEFVVSDVTHTSHRVYNMLARHAVLHLNPDYDRAVVAAMEKYISNPGSNWAGDVQISLINPSWKVYGLNIPLFYQNDAWTKKFTHIKLRDIRYRDIGRA
jgi:hypothetical protein